MTSTISNVLTPFEAVHNRGTIENCREGDDWPLTITKTENKFINVVLDRYLKLKWTILIRVTTAIDAWIYIVKDLVTSYGIPKQLLTDKDVQFVEKYFSKFA